MTEAIYLGQPALALAINLVILVLAWRVRRKTTLHRVFAFMMLNMTLWGLAILGMRSSPDLESAETWERVVLPAFPGITVAYLHFTLLYTQRRRLLRLTPVLYIFYLAFAAVAPTPLVLAGMERLPYGYAPVGGPLFIFPWITVQTLVYILGLVNLTRFYAVPSLHPEEKNRTLYLILATLCALLGATSDYLAALGFIPYPGGVTGQILFGILVATAILRHKLLDIRAVVQRSLVYFAFSSLVAAVYIGAIWGVNLLVQQRVASVAAQVTLLLVLAVALQPAIPWVQRVAERFLYGRRYEPLQALREFTAAAASIADLPGLSASLVKAVRAAMQCERVYLLMPTQEDGPFAPQADPAGGFTLPPDSPVLQWLSAHGSTLRGTETHFLPLFQALSAAEREELARLDVELFVPVKAQGRLTAVLALGPRVTGRPYTSQDEELLKTAALEAGMSLENARLYAIERRQVLHLHELDRMKTDFLSMVSHQLKTPITSIKAAMGLLSEVQPMEQGEPQRRLIASVTKGVASLEDLVSRLLDFARVKSARIHLEMERTDMAELVREAVAVVEPAVQERGQRLAMEVPPVACTVVVDRGRVLQVVLNLLNNANKYSPPGGSLTVRVAARGHDVVVSVEDSCGGIPREHLEWLFEGYYRPPSESPASSASGTGLGLSIARSLVELHGGRIWADAVAGKGCVFSFSLPLPARASARDPAGRSAG